MDEQPGDNPREARKCFGPVLDAVQRASAQCNCPVNTGVGGHSAVAGSVSFRPAATSETRCGTEEPVEPRHNSRWGFSRLTEELRHDPLRSTCLSEGSDTGTH